MNNPIQVSAWGIRHNLGPICLPVRREDGSVELVQVTQGEQNIRLSEVPRHLRETFGVEGMEIPDWFIRQASESERAAFADALASEGVVLRNVTLDGRCAGDGDAEFRADDLQELEESLTMIAAVGARAARVNLLPPGIVPGGAPAGFDEVVESLKRLLAHAEGLGVELLIENHCELTDTAEKVDKLRAAVGPGLGLILDTGNIGAIQAEVLRSFKAKLPPHDVEDAAEVFDFIAEMLPRATMVHVKTYGFREDGRPMLYDQERAIALIAESGYAGPVTVECASFEPPKVYDAISRTVAMLKAHLA